VEQRAQVMAEIAELKPLVAAEKLKVQEDAAAEAAASAKRIADFKRKSGLSDAELAQVVAR
jgi:hypothetical protein